MTIKMRNYSDPQDLRLVSDLLVRHYQPNNRDGNWLQPAWEYMHSHPALDESTLDRIGIWPRTDEHEGHHRGCSLPDAGLCFDHYPLDEHLGGHNVRHKPCRLTCHDRPLHDITTYHGGLQPASAETHKLLCGDFAPFQLL